MDAMQENTVHYARETFGDDIDHAYALVSGFKDPNGMNAPDDFVLEFFQIVEDHSSKLKGNEYDKLVVKLAGSFDQAVKAIDEGFSLLSSLSPAHRMIMWHLIDKPRPAIGSFDTSQLQIKIATEMSLTTGRLKSMSEALRIASNDSFSRGKRSRPAIPYVLPAYDFIICWQRWIPRTPHGFEVNKYQAIVEGRTTEEAKDKDGKRTKKRVPVHAIVRFVQLGLKLIDPEITSPMAVTCYNHARKFIGELR